MRSTTEIPILAHCRTVFDLTDIAEQEIKVAKRRWRRHAKRLEASFLLLCPTPGMTALAPSVYRAHAQELLERVAKGEDLVPGTEAEVMMVLSAGSLKAPLDQVHGALYERIFAGVFPWLVDCKPVFSEPWPGACDEALAVLRRKCAREARSGLPEK